MKRKLIIAAGLAVAALGVGLVPATASEPVRLTLPGPTGPYPVGTKELHLVDADRTDPWTGRPRELMVSIWYPAARNGERAKQFPPSVAAFYDQNAGVPPGTADFAGTRTHSRIGASPLPGRRPVVLYSPGGRSSRFLGTTHVEDLASRGYAVVGIDHTPVSPVQFPDRYEPPRQGVDAAQVMRERVRDTSFVLDELAAYPWLDRTRVGMFGHSMGGFTAAEAMVTEERIDAGVNLDGSMSPDAGQAATAGVTRPFLLMGGGLTGGAPHTHAHSADWASFWSASTGWKRDVYLPAAEHISFTDGQVLLPQIDGDDTAAIGTIDPRRSLVAQRKYVAAFFDLHLRGRPTAVFDRAAYPEVELIR
jgi:predicted dienelactone hydrolase